MRKEDIFLSCSCFQENRRIKLNRKEQDIETVDQNSPPPLPPVSSVSPGFPLLSPG